MDRKSAEYIMMNVIKVNSILNEIGFSADHLDAEHCGKFRRAIGLIVGQLYVEVMRPIIKQHPDLDPDAQ